MNNLEQESPPVSSLLNQDNRFENFGQTYSGYFHHMIVRKPQRSFVLLQVTNVFAIDDIRTVGFDKIFGQVLFKPRKRNRAFNRLFAVNQKNKGMPMQCFEADDIVDINKGNAIEGFDSNLVRLWVGVSSHRY